MRKVLDLNFSWRFSPDFKPEYTRLDFKDMAFKLVDLPHNSLDIPIGFPPTDQTDGISCYRKMFLLPPEMKNKRLVLHFEGVMGCAAVFVNGKPVCAHKGGFTPFECEITKEIAENVGVTEHLITVAVDHAERLDTAPYGGKGMHYGGGIYREVWLEATEEIYIKDMSVTTDGENDQWTLNIDGSISDTASKNIKIYLYQDNRKLAAKCVASENGRFSTVWKPTLKLYPWSISQPQNLYRIAACIEDGDEISFNIGLRTMEFKSDGFYLNKEKVKLIGICRNQLYPGAAGAMPAHAQHLDAQLIKNLGFNTVCTDGCPPSRHFLDECDRIGLLVIEDIPAGRGYVGDDEWQNCLLENQKELILRDRSHTCIAAWGTRAEDTAEAALFEKTNALAKQLDPLRATVGVRSQTGLAQIPEDIFMYSDCSQNSGALEKKKNVYKPKQPYMVINRQDELSQVRSYDGDGALLKQALSHARALDAAIADNEIIGYIAGDLCDYAVHECHSGTDNMRYCGVTDAFRIPKPAACVYISQSEEHTVMEAVPTLFYNSYLNPSIGAVCVFTNCDKVRVSRDNTVIGEFSPCAKLFPNLAHPPIIIDDLVGDLPCEQDGFELKELTMLKNQLLQTAQDEPMSAHARHKAYSTASSRLHISAQQFAALYDKYAGNGMRSAVYKLEGFKSGEVAAVSVLAPVKKTGIRVSCSRTELTSSSVCDCARIQLTATDSNGNRLYGCFETVNIEIEGSLEVIGSKRMSLIGGAVAFYVRTKGGKGAAKVKLDAGMLGKASVELDVSRIK